MSRSGHSTSRNPLFKRPEPKRPGRERPEREHGPRGPIVLTEAAGRRSDRLFGGPMPDGPLPGHLLVLLSRLHRAEAAPSVRKPAAPER